MPRSLLFVTGTRADFGKLEPLATAAAAAGHEVEFFVTGMHMLERYGMTKIEVGRVPNTKTHDFKNQDDGDPQDRVLARTIEGFSSFVVPQGPDLVVVHGDRVEALACALVCATNYIRCAHVEGGEVSGTIDEMFRHCNTKLAHHHFVSSKEARKRVMSLGEPDGSIHVIGSPELDRHSHPSGVSIDEVRDRYKIGFSDYGVCVLHPVTSEANTMASQADSFFSALEHSGRNFVVIMPNNDPGSDKIFKRIEALPKERFRSLPSMRFSHFSELLKKASVLVGNSSVGVREAPFLGLTSLDVGTRQNKRGSAPSIHACQPEDKKSIKAFLDKQWGKRHERYTHFGEGDASGRFVEELSADSFWARSLQKEFSDIV